MTHPRLSAITACAALALLLQPLAAAAQSDGQSGQQWFVPNQPKPAAPAVRPAPRPAAPPAAALGGEAVPLPEDQAAQQQQQIQVQLPPVPEVPPLPKGSPTPAAILGVLSVPDVLRVSVAYQQADKELGQRRQKLNEDAQKEQAALTELGKALANERAKMSPEQIRQKERELQDRIAESRRKFGERNRIIQESAQYIMAQIDRTMEVVAQQVALSRGINIVLSRAQVLGTTADFDLTPQVAEVLNKVLPTVEIPPDGVSPVTLHPVKPEASQNGGHAAPATAAAPAAKPAPASAKPAAQQKH